MIGPGNRSGRLAVLALALLIATCQPLPHPFADDRPPAVLVLEPRVGDLGDLFNPYLPAGARLAGGSDWTVSTPNVLKEAEVAVTRVRRGEADQTPLGPDEALDLVDVLAAFTSGAAYVNHLDAETGTVEVGKLADLVVLDRDIEAEERGRIGDATVLLTLIEGAPVHDAGLL